VYGYQKVAGVLVLVADLDLVIELVLVTGSVPAVITYQARPSCVRKLAIDSVLCAEEQQLGPFCRSGVL
jgi:hypothetical protein